MGPTIDIRGLRKHYGSVVALDGLELALPGGAVGLLGPNGAGKTTLIKLLLGLLEPDAGSASVLGLDPTDRRQRIDLRARVGYMPEGDCLLPGMNAVELLTALARITGLNAADAMTRAHEALDYVGLDEQRYRGIEQYSTGMKQRVKLAQALVHDPPLLLLDEPTNGLDPKGRRHMLELVADLGHAQRKHVILCSHLLPDVERTCDHVVVLHRGRAIKSGSIADLTRADGRRVKIRAAGELERFAAALAAAGLEPERDEDGAWTVPARGEDCDELFEIAGAAGTRIEAVEEVRSTLDQVFFETLKGSTAAREAADAAKASQAAPA
jgi:ABC-2 type transport system ATP-binding protein